MSFSKLRFTYGSLENRLSNSLLPSVISLKPLGTFTLFAMCAKKLRISGPGHLEMEWR